MGINVLPKLMPHIFKPSEYFIINSNKRLMSILHSMLACSYPLLNTSNKVLKYLKLGPSGNIRILLYHDIPLKEQPLFSAQLQWLAQRWTFITPEQFVSMQTGSQQISGNNLLLTFDDGFYSNRRIVEEVLNPRGIKAIFFINSDFIDLIEESDCRSFVSKNYWPGMSDEEVPKHLHNMSWDDLKYLIDSGHTIGAHTRTHARLSELKQENEIEEEIIRDANKLESKLGVPIDHFAFPFGNLSSFSPSALSVAMQRFRFIYSGLRGANASGVPPWALRRDAINPSNSFRLIGALLEGGADIFYSRDISKFQSWGLNKS